jgi:hypothetical protein
MSAGVGWIAYGAMLVVRLPVANPKLFLNIYLKP